MILNGFGFVERRLYLYPEFFEGIALERLLGPGVKREHLPDYTLGRTLDAIAEYGRLRCSTKKSPGVFTITEKRPGGFMLIPPVSACIGATMKRIGPKRFVCRDIPEMDYVPVIRDAVLDRGNFREESSEREGKSQEEPEKAFSSSICLRSRCSCSGGTVDKGSSTVQVYRYEDEDGYPSIEWKARSSCSK